MKDEMPSPYPVWPKMAFSDWLRQMELTHCGQCGEGEIDYDDHCDVCGAPSPFRSAQVK